MYPSSTSSSSQGSIGTGTGGGGGLARYGSAPSSFLTAGVNAAVGAGKMRLVTDHFFTSEPCNSAAVANNDGGGAVANTTIGLRPPSYGFGCATSSASVPASLVRQRSSPAGFLNQLASAAGADNSGGEFSLHRGIENCISMGIGDNGGSITRLHSQLSFTGPPKTRSHISAEGADHHNRQYMNPEQSKYHQYGNDANHPILFSVAPPSKTTPAASHIDHANSQFQFSMSRASNDQSPMDKLLSNIPEDSVPCRIRAKRGYATHPRSIAERERRTRISRKLKKLQDLVPNMDKQTSYADMLDLAVQHIKTLQNHVQKLNKDIEGCSCGSKKHRDH